MSLKTALAICQQYRYSINQPAPSALTSSTDPDERQQLWMLTLGLEYLRDEGPFRSHLRSHDFTTSDGVTTYALPGDYWQASPLTQYNEDTDYRLLGPLSDADFALYRERGWSTPYDYIWRIAGFNSSISSTAEGRLFEIYPAPGAGENLGYDYFSGNLFLPAAWFASQDQNTHNAIAADTDYCAFDSNLVMLALDWQYKDKTSNDRGVITAAKDVLDDAIKAARFRHHGNRRGQFGKKRRPWYAIPEKNWSFS